MALSYPGMNDRADYALQDRRGRCMIDDKHRVVYMNNPRVASTSCKTALGDMGGKLTNHLEERINLTQFSVFGIVRYPVDRFISTFVFLSSRHRLNEYGRTEQPYFQRRKMDATKLDMYLGAIEGGFFDPHTQPQCWWFTDKEFSPLAFDRLFVLDGSLSTRVGKYLSALAGSNVGFPHQEKTPDEQLAVVRDLLSDDTSFLRRIHDIYACDFDLYEDTIE